MKLLYLFNQRKHFKNRLKLRKGNIFYFLLAKPTGTLPVYDSKKQTCTVWKYKNHIFLTQNNQLQTYIKK